MVADGSIQIKNVNIAKRNPPTFQAIPTNVWVEEGPGKSCDRAFSSISSPSVIYRCLSTNSRINTARWAWGPPKDVNVYKITSRINKKCLFLINRSLVHWFISSLVCFVNARLANKFHHWNFRPINKLLNLLDYSNSYLKIIITNFASMT